MQELKWLGIGCAVLGGIAVGGIGLHAWFGDKTGLVILLAMLFIGAGAVVGDILRGIVGQR